METGGIDEHVLILTLGKDTRDAVTGGLGLAGDDGNLLAQKGVEQGGFAYVGLAGNGNKSCSCHFLVFLTALSLDA